MIWWINCIISSLFMSRFKKLEVKLSKKGVKDPGALAAWIGRKKYGASKFRAMAVKGMANKMK